MTDDPGDSAVRRAAPLRGDIRVRKMCPTGTACTDAARCTASDQCLGGDYEVMAGTKPYPLHLITEFEVWDGLRWVSSSEADTLQYMVQ